MDFEKRNLSPAEKLEFAALKMEADKADQLRAQWEAIESGNTEKLSLLLADVETFKKRTDSRVFKTKLSVGQWINSDAGEMWSMAASILIPIAILGVGVAAIPNPNDVMMVSGAFLPVAGSIGMAWGGMALGETAKQYSKNNQIKHRNEVFNSIDNLTSSTNEKLHMCMQQLYALASDEKIPAPFWEQCQNLLHPIVVSANAYALQQQGVKNGLEKLAASQPEPTVVESFSARHANFVAVQTKSLEEQGIEPTQPQIKPQIIKI